MSRNSRMAEQIRREMSILIQQELKDPRLGMVTVSDVDLSKDLSVAKIYVTRLDMEDFVAEDVKVVLKVLEKSSGFLKKQLGSRLILRSIPSLKFFYDESIERGQKLSSLIDEAVSADKAISQTDSNDN